MEIEKAELSDGRTLEYVVVPGPPAGGTKCTYFAQDRSYMVQFDHSENPSQRVRLDAIFGRYSPTLDQNPKVAAYWCIRTDGAYV